MTQMKEWIARYWANHKDIPEGHHDGEVVAELIRCKDCKWWPYHPIERQIGYVKTFLCAIPPASREDENGFCSMAERKSK